MRFAAVGSKHMVPLNKTSLCLDFTAILIGCFVTQASIFLYLLASEETCDLGPSGYVLIMPKLQARPRWQKIQINKYGGIGKCSPSVRKGMSYRKAADKFGIPKIVIYRHMKNDSLKPQGGQTALSLKVEQIILEK
nr:uncharacterized protein LOC124809164 [Hydra vulgaris]